jgi:transposase
VAFELSDQRWTLGSTIGLGQPIRRRTVRAGDWAAVDQEIAHAKRRFGVAPTARVRSCSEAGREGFSVHRALVARGVTNHVVDAASIEVPRRLRRVKTDRLDVGSLVRMLQRYAGGEHQVWSVVRVPSRDAEDARQLARELRTTKDDRTQVTNRVRGLLASQGLRLPRGLAVPQWLATPAVEREVGPWLRARLEREWAKVALLTAQIQTLEAAHRRLLRGPAPSVAVGQMQRLHQLRAVGPVSAVTLALELYSWRQFRNRREVGALTGLTPTPYASGQRRVELGISKAGIRQVRAVAIELAWAWLRWQPTSELTVWYQQRFGGGSARVRKIGIVAVARRLLIALWRYLETGVPPAGALMR